MKDFARPPRSLELREVSVWRGQREVVSGVSLELRPGELWVLVGPNGSGKTSLLEALLGALPCSGYVTLGGLDLLRLAPRERARHLTLLGRELAAQSALTVQGLVELGRLPYLKALEPLGESDRQAVQRALERTGVAPLATRQLSQLSDGERQRAYLARAFAQQPHVLLLDEATSHLDLLHREHTLLGIRSYIADQRLALMAVHDLELAVRHASHVAVLNRGRLVAAGPLLETLTTPRIAEVFGVEAQVTRDARGTQLRIFGSAPTQETTPCNSPS